MNLIRVSVAALISLFVLTIGWMALYGPFILVVDGIQAPLSAATSGQAKQSIDMYEALWRLGMGLFFVLSALGTLMWWIMKMQERELQTEAVAY